MSGERPPRDSNLEDGTEDLAAPKPGLYLVATPIGNARDITLRALDTLKAADVIACEDTRVSGPFLTRLGVQRPLVAYHDFSDGRARRKLMERVEGGEVVALISDAGTPLISDPGYRLVADCVAAGLHVTALPGPSSVMGALSVSGLPTDRFLFTGFLPAKRGARARLLEDLARIEASLVLMVPARALAGHLAEMAEVLGASRQVAVTRELTKRFEEVRRGTLQDMAQTYADEGPPKGEVTLVVGPPAPMAKPDIAAGDMDAALRSALEEASVSDAAKRLAKETGLSKRDLYNRALQLTRQTGKP